MCVQGDGHARHDHYSHEHHDDHDPGHTCTEHCHHEGERHSSAEPRHSHLDHKHDSRVTSVGIVMEGNCDMRKLNSWLSTLLQERGPDLFRSKGILSVAGSDDK